MADEYRVAVKGTGINFDKAVTEDVANEVMILVLGGQLSGGKRDDKKTPPKPGSTDPDLSIGDYVETHNAKTNPAKVTAIGNYLHEHDGAGQFTKQELLDGFENANETSPAYFDRDLRRAVSAKWIAPKRGTKDTFYVTGTGKKALADNFGKSGGRLPRRRRPKKAATAKKTAK